MKISIIVPVYNGAKTLERCVDSLRAQTHKDLEILLIDDGSTDGSGEICDEYMMSDSRVRAYHTPNQGVGAARQYGLDRVSGTYFINADCDDWVEREMIEKLAWSARIHNSDMVISDYYLEKDGSREYVRQTPLIPTPSEILRDILSGRLIGSTWNKLIRSELITRYKTRFVAGINYCEDVLLLTQLLLEDIRISHIPMALYHYDYGAGIGSITRSYTQNTLSNRMEYIERLAEMLPKGYEDEIEHAKFSVKYEAFSHNMLSKKEVRDIYPELTGSIFSFNQSLYNKTSFYLACKGMNHLGYGLYRFKNIIKR